MNILSTAYGYYVVSDNQAEADCLVGNSFGTLIEKGSVNGILAEQMLSLASGRPIIVDRMLADAFPKTDTSVDYIVEGTISNATGTQGGTWQTLLEAKDIMEKEGLTTALMFAHANHIGRVLMQAKKLGMECAVPEGLPRSFDSRSEQWWTRGKPLWIPREVLGSILLKVQKKL